MSKEDAQRMLDALENQEKKTMEKVNEQKVRQQPKKKSDKDWWRCRGTIYRVSSIKCIIFATR